MSDDTPVDIKRFHWIRRIDSPKTGSAHIAIRCPECEMISRTTQFETPDASGLLDFTCRSEMDLCRWDGLVRLVGWKNYNEAMRTTNVG